MCLCSVFKAENLYLPTEMKVGYLFNLYALYKDSGAFPKGKQDHVWWTWLELSHLPPS